ncbi:hypothetical protein ACQUEF_10300 [Vagococcus fluvialis]|jgi:hypothetical protein|uniref:hypothetical protein n=1 Tax=Vagococcus fluvialis TaxID=2738 RepID=UPI00282C6CBA|nr:hypothetical protein [Vagococcus sp.]
MEKRKNINKTLITMSIIGLISWLFFSVKFFYCLIEASEFATEGAQPIVQILEILNYRGQKLLPYLIVFFLLVSFSLLFEIYLFLYTKKYQLNQRLVVLAGIVITFFIILNLINELFLLLLVLVVVSVLIMLSISLTVHYLYVEDEEMISVNGPFKTLSTAEKYADKKINQLKKKMATHELTIKSSIDLEVGDGYYVTIYIEETDNRGNEDGEENVQK